VGIGVKAVHALQAPEEQLALLRQQANTPAQAASTFSLRQGMQGMQGVHRME
jgi:hypothetical protein